MVTKGQRLQKFVAKVVTENKMTTVAGQILFEYEKKIR